MFVAKSRPCDTESEIDETETEVELLVMRIELNALFEEASPKFLDIPQLANDLRTRSQSLLRRCMLIVQSWHLHRRGSHLLEFQSEVVRRLLERLRRNNSLSSLQGR